MNCITVLQIPATDYCNTNYMQFLLHTIVQSAILILVTGNSIIYQKSFFHKKFSGKNKTSAKLLCWGFQQRYKDSNLEMTESESVALPFGDSAIFYWLMLTLCSTLFSIYQVSEKCKYFFYFFQTFFNNVVHGFTKLPKLFIDKV